MTGKVVFVAWGADDAGSEDYFGLVSYGRSRI